MECEFCTQPVDSAEQVHGQTICETCLDAQVKEAMERAFDRYLSKRRNTIPL